MKLILLVIALATVLAGCREAYFSPSDTEAMYPFRTTKLARDLRVCPYGHHTLKDIPIMYGLPDFSGDNQAILDQKIKNHEITLGGCVVMPDAPKVETTCLTCGFSYSQRDDSWLRSSADPESFNPAISELVRSISPDGAAERHFAVSVEHDKTVSESVSIDSNISLHDLVSYMLLWIDDACLQKGPERQAALIAQITNEWFVSGIDGAWSVSARQRYGGKGSRLFFSRHVKPANQMPEPTSGSVTPRADARVAPPPPVAHR